MPTITDIKPQKKSQQLYNIYVDDKFALGISDLQISLLGLKIGQTITQERLAELSRDVQQQKAYHRALYYLKFRARSEKEMTDYLKNKNFDEPVIDVAIGKLKSKKLLDDAAFSQQWIKNRLQFQHYPLRKIRAELYQKGIDKEVTEQAVAELDDEAEADSLRELVKQKRRQSKYREPPKLLAYLVGRGYSYGLVKQVLAEQFSGENRYFNENADDDQPKQP